MEQSYWSTCVNWTEGPLNEGPRPSRGKVRCLVHDIILEGDTNG